MTLRYGVIGFGRFGQLHSRFIERTEGASLAAIAVRSEASAKAAAAAHPGATIHLDYKALIADPDIDVVDIVAPNNLHAAMAIAALNAGKHVLLEKPLATTRADCDAVLAAAKASGRQLSVGFELRLSAQWGRIRELIAEGAIGRPHYAALGLFRHPYKAGASGWRHDAKAVGSWILEEPVHFYDLLMWYMEELGAPVAVSGHGTLAGGPGMYDNFSSVIEFDGGGYATITQCLAGFGHHLVLDMAGDGGAIRATWSASTASSEEPEASVMLLRKGADEPETIELASHSGELFELEEEIRRVTKAFARGQTLVGPEPARRAVVVCLEAERAVRENRKIRLELDRMS